MKDISINDFQITEKINIKDLKTTYDLDASEDKIEDELEEVREKLGKLQDTMYAHGKYAVLVCLQGMDTAGKDSLIREVFKDFNTRGIVVHSFKVPTELELRHDYLWRHYIALPERGKFGVLTVHIMKMCWLQGFILVIFWVKTFRRSHLWKISMRSSGRNDFNKLMISKSI